MARKKGLGRDPLRERRAREEEKARRRMLGSQYIRRNFVITPADDYLLEELVKRIRDEMGIEITKSALVRKAIHKLRGEDIGKIVGV